MIKEIIKAVLVAAITALITSYIPEIVDAIRYRELPNIGGKWIGGFKEWCPEKDCPKPKGPGWRISIENLDIKQWGSRLSVSARTEDLRLRDWEASGRFRIPVLAATYVDKTPGVVSVGGYVLAGDPNYERFHGYWTGHDRDLNKIVTCPYFLLRERIPRQKIEAEEWLKQACFVATK